MRRRYRRIQHRLIMFGAFLPLVDTDSQLHNEILSLMIKCLPTYSATCFLRCAVRTVHLVRFRVTLPLPSLTV